MILTRQNCVLLNTVQELIEIETWLLLSFFTCLHNQLSSIDPIVICYRAQIFEQSDSSNRQKMNGCSLQQLLLQNLGYFRLDTGSFFLRGLN